MSRLLDSYAEAHLLDFMSREPYKTLVPERTPPGYPLGYVRERVTITCHCGNIIRYSRLLVVNKTSSKGRQIRPCGLSEPVYDLEVAEVEATGGTPVCDACWDRTPHEATPRLPEPRRKIGHTRPAELTLNIDDYEDLL
jgi:hypothetical protein